MKKIFFVVLFISVILGSSLLTMSVLGDDKLPPPEKISPANNQKDVSPTVTFKWRGVTGADKYEIIVWLAGGNQQAAQNILTATEKTFKLNEGITYWWDVRACHEAGFLGLSHDCDEQEFGGHWVLTTKGTAPLEITTKNLPNGTIGLEYNQQIQAQGGTPSYAFSIKSGALPSGLNLSSDGKIIGTPTKNGAGKKSDFTVRVIDNASQVASKDLSIFIEITQLKITNPPGDTMPSGTIGEYYEFVFNAAGGIPSYTWSNTPLSDDLPRKGISDLGLSLSSSGKISGTPTQSGNFRFGVTVKGDSILESPLNKALKQLHVLIKSVLFEITTAGLPSGEISKPYTATLSAHGGTPPYSWSIAAGTLPDGLKLSGSTISGTPTKAGNFSFSALVKNAEGEEVGETFSIIIETSCQCSDGTACDTPKANSPPLYCDRTTKTLIEKCGIAGCPLLQKICQADGSCVVGTPSQCADGTPLNRCKTSNPPSYCDGTTKTLINKCGVCGCPTNQSCQANGSCISDTQGATTGGDSSSGEIPKGKLEVAWPNSPMGTSLDDDSKLTDLIKYFYEWGISLGGFAAFIALIIAGFQYLTSAGNAMRMKDAMDRIKSAALGLVLLLGSFLILNTINPQLTELKMPPFETGTNVPTLPEPGEVDLKAEECKGATLYSGPKDNPGSIVTELEPPNDQETPLTGKDVGSIKMTGSCKLTLYKLTDFRVNSDNESFDVYGEVPSTASAYGTTKFGSVKLSEISF